MVEIIPAILPPDFNDLRSKLSQVRNLVRYVQIDICDGEFVPSVTWPYGDPDAFSKIISDEEGMPFWQDLQFEFDLMVARPEEVVQDWIDAGASRVIIHNKSTEKLGEILEKLEFAQIERGVALQVDEDPSSLTPLIEKIDYIQYMGIGQIGKQGEPFAPEVVHKIKEVRSLFPDILISVDGGVSLNTVKVLSDAGANRLVSGSGVFGSGEPKENIAELERLAND